MRNFYPSIIESRLRTVPDAVAFVLIPLALLLALITWPFFQLWRYYQLKSRGYHITGKTRNEIEYQELNEGKLRRLTIYVETMVKAPDVVYLPTETEWEQHMPSWAQGRREEIVERVKRALGTKRYEYVSEHH